ncbi:hypothetical protein [Gemmatimonas sp.]|uniref:hypothetical protein n=1 Tax=Gemmatimonas sp. TaxID=1962908 RepID=UPI0025B8F771|nr:hypothetical protein [Gemmatimonas sp.]MCA2992069.1 hypothetical protein [Gemmatimonas sp.]
MPRLPEGFIIDENGDLVPLRRRRLTQVQFMRRRTLAERVTLTALRIDPTVPLELRAALTTLAELRDMADDINLDDPDTQDGVAFAINVLTTLPVGTPGRIDPTNAAAAVDAWLADFPQPGELVI